MRKWLVVLALVVAVVAVAVRARSGPRVRPGVARLDMTVYHDPERDARPVSDVIRPVPGARAPRPNVVIIMADDLGYGDLGAYGNVFLRTPHLDQLAQRGMRFTDFYASHSTCSPSRAGLLTGRYPLRTGINFPIQPADDSPLQKLNRRFGAMMAVLGVTDMVETADSALPGLPLSEVTLAEALKVAGYATGLVGKWHLGDFRVYPEYHPHRHGFDFFAGVPYSNDNFPYQYWRNDRVIDENLGLRQGEVTARLTREAVDFIAANADRPFFLYFAHKNVHTPLVPAPEFAGRSPAGPYGDSVEELDWSVGEVMRALEERGLTGRTLVFFTSDNGPWHLGNPGLLRGRKGQPMEGGQRVPGIAHWPGYVPAGAVATAPTMNIDLFPTILALAGLEGPRDRVIDGRDIGGLLGGRETAGPHEALFFFNANVIDGARSGRWKYYRWVNTYTWPIPLDKVNTLAGRSAHAFTYTDPVTGQTMPLLAPPRLLFDVTADPNESYNLVERHPDEAARIQAAIERWERDFFANPRGWQ